MYSGETDVLKSTWCTWYSVNVAPRRVRAHSSGGGTRRGLGVGELAASSRKATRKYSVPTSTPYGVLNAQLSLSA